MYVCTTDQMQSVFFRKTCESKLKTALMFLMVEGPIKILGMQVFLRIDGKWKHKNFFRPNG